MSKNNFVMGCIYVLQTVIIIAASCKQTAALPLAVYLKCYLITYQTL